MLVLIAEPHGSSLTLTDTSDSLVEGLDTIVLNRRLLGRVVRSLRRVAWLDWIFVLAYRLVEAIVAKITLDATSSTAMLEIFQRITAFNIRIIMSRIEMVSFLFHRLNSLIRVVVNGSFVGNIACMRRHIEFLGVRFAVVDFSFKASIIALGVSGVVRARSVLADLKIRWFLLILLRTGTEVIGSLIDIRHRN